MIDISSSAVIKVTDGRQRSLAVFWLIVVNVGWVLFVWPFVALTNQAAPWPIPVGYLVVLTGLLAVGGYRSARVALIVRDDELTVRNFCRTRRVRWPEVARLSDGYVRGGWTLTVLLANGRAVNSTAASNESPRGNPQTLTVLRQAAVSHGVPEDITGIPLWRPRAWEDAVSAAGWYKVWLGVWLLVTAAAVAGLVVVSEWNGHHTDYGPVFIPVACAALIALFASGIAWRRWRQALRPEPGRLTAYGEGEWFAVPLDNSLHAVGVIARRQQYGKGIMIGYFFAPFDSPRPAIGRLAELRPADAILIAEFATTRIRDGEPSERSWPRLGRVDGWDRAAWPVPVFKRTDPKTKEHFKVFYDDQLRFLREEPANRRRTRDLPRWGPMTETAVKAGLNLLLNE